MRFFATRLFAFVLALLVTATLTTTVTTTAAYAETPDLKHILADRVHGNANAPVTMIEYASLTCGHCADFAVKILPELEKKYVETGQLKIIYRDFPLDGAALRAAAVARCLPQERYFAFVKLLFQRQQNWAFAADPQKELTKLAALAGLSPATAATCMTDMKIMDALTKARTEAGEKHSIRATPTFILSGKSGAETVLSGNRPVAEFIKVIDEKLGQAPKATTTTAAPTPTAPTPAATKP